ncbi:hypothetical protein D3C74_388330 [compost metagenome]
MELVGAKPTTMVLPLKSAVVSTVTPSRATAHTGALPDRRTNERASPPLVLANATCSGPWKENADSPEMTEDNAVGPLPAARMEDSSMRFSFKNPWLFAT